MVKETRKELRELREKHRQEITAFRRHQVEKESVLEDKLAELLKTIPKPNTGRPKRKKSRYPLTRFEVGDFFSGDRDFTHWWRITKIEGSAYYIQYNREGDEPLTTTLNAGEGYTYHYMGKYATT